MDTGKDNPSYNFCFQERRMCYLIFRTFNWRKSILDGSKSDEFGIINTKSMQKLQLLLLTLGTVSTAGFIF